MLDRLTVRRRFARSSQPHLGFEAEIPCEELPEAAPPTAHPWDALGWSTCVPPGAAITSIHPVGLLHPTPWERGYVAWLGRTHRATVATDWDAAPAPRVDNVLRGAPRLMQAIDGLAPFSTTDALPPGVVLQRAASAVVEARHTAAELRRWLLALPPAERAPATDSILILMPDDPERLRVWIAELRRADLPVRATSASPLAGQAFARWMVAVARLAGWSDASPRPRGLIEQVFSGRFWSATAARRSLGIAEPDDGDTAALNRRRLVECVASLRRSSVTLAGWCEHLQQSRASAEDADRPWRADGLAGWAELSRAVASALQPGSVTSLRRLLDPHRGETAAVQLGVRALLAAKDERSEVAAPALALLDSLERRELMGSIGADEEPRDTPAKLEDALAGLYSVEELFPEHGVTLLPYGLYDGRPSSRLVLTGLEEGGYPVPPPLPTAVGAEWLAALCPAAEGDQSTDRVRALRLDELERQVAVVRTALEQCVGEARFSFCRQGTGTEDRHPGPLLSLLVGAWKPEDWASGRPGVVDLQRSRELPGCLDDAETWADARLLGQHEGVIDVLTASGHADSRARDLATAHAALASTRAATAEREPLRDDAVPGPWTGRLPGAAEGPRAHSPTSLEQFGQCGTRYFLAKVLRVEDDGEEAEDPSAMEMGSFVHEVFARATWDTVDLTEPQLLDFDVDPSDPRGVEGRIDDLHADLAPRLRASLRAAATAQPTFSAQLLDEISARWSQALRNWLKRHVRVAKAATMDADALADTSAVVRAEARLAAIPIQRARLAALRARIDGSRLTKTAWTEYLVADAGLGKTRFGKAWNKEPGSALLGVAELEAELDLAEAAAPGALEKARQVQQRAQDKEREARESWVARRAAHAELSFGPTAGGDDDPCSSSTPVTLQIDGVTLQVKGQIDRVDWDPDRQVLAVRDYKSGGKTSSNDLRRKTCRGLSIQLLLYAEALQALVDRGDLPHLAGSRVAEVALEFPKMAAAAGFRPDEGSGLAASAGGDPSALEELTMQELGGLWIASHIRGIEAGRFDLLPEACPKVESGAYCDFDRICGFRPAFADRLTPRPGLPALVPIPPTEEPTPKDEKKKTRKIVLPPCHDVDIDPDGARREHDAACERIADSTRDAVVSAGAGTGKTWNLVRRYTAALTASLVPDPQAILCVTFTRRAAGEMKQRIRAALLDDTAGLFSTEVLRTLVLELSAAPISTLDALALRIVQEREAHDGSSRSASVSEPSVVRAELRSFVSERFLEAVEAGDPDLRTVLDQVTVSKAREALTKAVEGGLGDTLDDPTEAGIEATWWSLIRPLLDRAVQALGSLDVAAGQDALSATKTITPDLFERMQRALDAADHLVSGEASTDAERLVAVADVWAHPTRSNLNQPVERWVRGQLDPTLSAFGASLSRDEAELFKALRKGPDLAGLARVVAAGVRLAARWGSDLDDLLRSRGTLRYSDVETMAVEALQRALGTGSRAPDVALRDHLAARLPFAHIFVDESQDTSERQVALVKALRDLCGARLFWVGDPKQSIYRFRGAEVDVFEALVAEAGGDVLHLQTNRRSSPPLIRSVNRLFAALLPATAGVQALDPGSEIPYVPLTWPAEDDDRGEAEPAIELIAEPGKGWPLQVQDEHEEVEPQAGSEDGDDGSAGDEHGADSHHHRRAEPLEAAPTGLEDALCRRVAALAAEAEGRATEEAHSGPGVAILVHSWARAERYRSLLALPRYGVTAAVQGGRGLLSTPAVEGVVVWLEAAARNSDVGLVGALRGPGVSLSDPGLLCLKRLWGLRRTEDDEAVTPPVGLRRAATSCRLVPSEAARAWQAVTPVDASELLATLEVDASSLARFVGSWGALVGDLRSGSVADAAARLIDRLELEGWWLARPGGRQAVANLAAFVQLLRDTEATLGTDGPGVLRALEASRDSDDPAAGGLDAGDGAAVVITTFWQAKGLEWPVVVLPDLHKTGVKGDATALGAARVLDPSTNTAVRVAELRVTRESAPFSTESTILTTLIDQHRKPALRAELRRLLYVAMTRPERRLVLSGTFNAPSDKKAWRVVQDGTGTQPKTAAMSLDTANSWAETLMVCTGLTFDERGQPHLGSAVWTDDDVLVRSVAEVLADPVDLPSPPLAVPLPSASALAGRWAPVEAAEVLRVKPSDVVSDVVPEPIAAPAWPTKVPAPPTPFGTMRLEGNGFHGLMERWGFGAGGTLLDRELVLEVLTELDLAPHPKQAERIRRLLDLVARAREGQPELFDRLLGAAEAGLLLHEVPLRFIDALGRHVVGQVDLMWREAGAWNIIDYKAGWNVPTDEDRLQSEVLRKNHGQVELYREGVSTLLEGAALATTGIWYVSRGLVLQWA